ADVVSHVVGNDSGIARIIFRNTGFNLAHQVGADIGTLGEYAAPKTGKYGNQRTAERHAYKSMSRFRFGGPHAGKDGKITRNAEQAQAHHQHASNRTALE